MVRDAVGVTFINHWGSAHLSGVQFLFADSSVRIVPYETPDTIVQALLTPNGGEVVPEF